MEFDEKGVMAPLGIDHSDFSGVGQEPANSASTWISRVSNPQSAMVSISSDRLKLSNQSKPIKLMYQVGF
jgi:hypothetical protein